MACQQLFIDLRQQMAHYRPTLSHNENQEGALLLSGGVRRELMKEGGREGHHAAWDPVNGALLPWEAPPAWTAHQTSGKWWQSGERKVQHLPVAPSVHQPFMRC